MQRPRGGGALDPLWETAGSPGREVVPAQRWTGAKVKQDVLGKGLRFKPSPKGWKGSSQEKSGRQCSWQSEKPLKLD